jgi:hypothetical protein
MPKLLGAEHWSARAEETRVLADLMQDEDARTAMLTIAANYEKLATMARAVPGIAYPDSCDDA